MNVGRTVEAADGEDVEDAHVEIGGDHVAREGDHRRRAQREDSAARTRREVEERAVGALGDDVLLLEQLDDVGERLEEPDRADHRGAEPGLHPTRELALEPDADGHARRGAR